MFVMVRSAIVVAAGVLLAGCSVYDVKYQYDPRPIAVETRGADQHPVRTLVSVIGVRRFDKQSNLPASVEVRLRLENTGRETARFDPASLALFSAGLQEFPTPIVRPGGPAELTPGSEQVFDVFFPFPGDQVPGDFDLNGLNLRWTVEIAGETTTESVSFARLPEAYYDRYPHRTGVGYHRFDAPPPDGC